MEDNENKKILSDLKENNTYLLLMFSEVKSYTMLIVTEKAYYIRTNNGLESETWWDTKENISENYKFIEDITEKFNSFDKRTINQFNKSEIKEETEEIYNEVKQEYVRCHICKGLGLNLYSIILT